MNLGLVKDLTERQLEVATLVARGLRNKEAACLLYIEEKTIKFHLTAIYKVLGLKNRQDLYFYFANFNTQSDTLSE